MTNKFSFRVDEKGFKTTFSIEQDAILKEKYLSTPVKSLCKLIGKSSCGVKGRMRQLNLIIPQELADERKKGGMFRGGQVPYNKGKKQVDFMSPEAIEKTKATRFKKNHLPHNAKQNWEEVKRKDKNGHFYLMIKLPENRKLVYKHIWLWEGNHGKISEGYNVIFKNGNSMDCVIENLEKVSDAELMLRNTIHRYPEELKTQMRKVSKLKRIIKKKTHE